MKTEWRMFNKPGDFFGLAQKFGVDPAIIRILRNKDITEEEDIEQFLSGTIEKNEETHRPELMLDMDLGVDIIASSIEAGENIRVVGDYDVDGVTSTYILYDGIKRAGGNVSYDIPHRIHDGYGINERIIMQAYEDSVDTIITCDNGISALDAINKAVALGMTVVVTDHHEIPPVLPDADAIINPHQEGDAYPYKEICGAMVAYKFIKHLYKRMDISDKLGDKAYLDVLALATNCDVMPLVDENRIYLKEGIKVMENTSNLGLRTLLDQLGLSGKKITGYTLGFVIGPTINAAGKLGDAKDAVELLITEDPEFAVMRARDLAEENASRKRQTDEGLERAISELEMVTTEDGEEPKDKVLLVYIPGIHEGVAGIIAGRIRDRYYRPVVVFTDTIDPDVLKGSGRSIETYNMFEKIGEFRDMTLKFGGHPMAAGMSVKRDIFDEFRRKVNENSGLTDKDLTEVINIDIPMPLSYGTISLAEQIEALGPFGKGNKSPLFGQLNMEILGYEVKGERQNLLLVKLRDPDGQIFTVKNFRPQEFEKDINRWFTAEECDKMKRGVCSGCLINIIYKLDINDFRGRNLEYKLEYYNKA